MRALRPLSIAMALLLAAPAVGERWPLEDSAARPGEAYDPDRDLAGRLSRLKRCEAQSARDECLKLLISVAQLLGGVESKSAREAFARRAVAVARAHVPDSDPDYWFALRAWDEVLAELGRFAEAEPLFRERLRLSMRDSPDDEELIAGLGGEFAAILEALGRHAEAEPLRRREIAYQERATGTASDPVWLFGSYVALAANLETQVKWGEAEAWWRKAERLMEAPAMQANILRHRLASLQTSVGLALSLERQGKVPAEVRHRYRVAARMILGTRGRRGFDADEQRHMRLHAHVFRGAVRAAWSLAPGTQ